MAENQSKLDPKKQDYTLFFGMRLLPQSLTQWKRIIVFGVLGVIFFMLTTLIQTGMLDNLLAYLI